ncbi:MAG: EpsI family protein [Planctomycetes bacterium]|nr:EpsI family protein [Planctomycetota bacterium]
MEHRARNTIIVMLMGFIMAGTMYYIVVRQQQSIIEQMDELEREAYAYDQGYATSASYRTVTTDVSLQYSSYQSTLRSRFPVIDNPSSLPLNVGSSRGRIVDPEYPDVTSFAATFENDSSANVVHVLLVKGFRVEQFHSAEVCYRGAGWEYVAQDVREFDLGESRISARYGLARKDGKKHLIVYWYNFRDARRVVSGGTSMIRVSVDVRSDLATAERDLQAFLTGVFADAEEFDYSRAQQVQTGAQARPLSRDVVESRDWLISNIVPNEVVPNPPASRRGLVLSYRISESDPSYRYVYSKSALYDNALAAIALTITGDFDQAAGILQATLQNASEDGRLWFSMNTHNTLPDESDASEAIDRTGPAMWMGYAICFYLQAQLEAKGAMWLAMDDEGSRFLRLAEQIALRYAGYLVEGRNDQRRGLLAGGEGSYVLAIENEEVVENFVPGAVPWSSIEHNLGAYFFFRLLSKVSGSDAHLRTATDIGRAVERCWNQNSNQFNRGARVEGPDVARALDCASWGSIYWTDTGSRQKAALALSQTEAYFIRTPEASGFVPYLEEPVYEDASVGERMFPGNPRQTWDDLGIVWSEGSFGVALAHIRADNKVRAAQIVEGLTSLRASGGYRCASADVPFQMGTPPSVAGTAWYIIVKENLAGNETAERFWNNGK